MIENTSHRIWTQSKSSVYFNIAVVSVINLIGLGLTILFWQKLDILQKSALLGSFFLSIPFLLMYVMSCSICKDGIVFFLPHKEVKMQLTDIASARVTKRISNEYLEIRTNKPIGFRKRFPFLIEKNKDIVAETLNYLMTSGVNVYTNSTLETQVKFNSETKKFECL